MRTFARYSTVPLLAALLFVSVFVSACDSGDPDDGEDPRDVSGRYAFTRFEFEPSASGVLQPINLLDTLVTSQTSLQLSGDGFYFLSYGFVGGDFYTLRGQFRVTAASVRLNGDDDQRASYERIFLTDEFVLRREGTGGVLTADIPKTINPSEYSDKYEGITSVSGTLHLRLEKD